MAIYHRRLPNILITGTPGVGKSTICTEILSRWHPSSESSGESCYKHVPLSTLIEEQKLYREWDDDLNCSIFEEDLVVNALEDFLEGERGGNIIDFHSCDFMKPHWFDLVVVLRADTDTLWKRLETRSYPEESIQANVQSEIFEVVLDEAKEAFESTDESDTEDSKRTAEIRQLTNNTLEDMLQNCEHIMEWMSRWCTPME